MSRFYKSLFNFGSNILFRSIIATQNKSKPVKYRRLCPAVGIVSFFLRKKTDDIPIITVLIQNADTLFDEERYVDVYNLLLQCKEERNVEIHWRICRTLFKMIQLGEYGAESNRAILLEEAYNLISKSLELHKNHAQLQKWMAILLDEKLHTESTIKRISGSVTIVKHLMKAHELNSNDYTVLFLLGSWCYNISKLTWFQKKLATLIFKDLPICSSEDALNYFLKAEEIKPKYCLSNMYMLGKINYEMGNMYRAHYYLTLATEMYPLNDREIQYVTSAQKLVKRLKEFDVSEEAL